MVYNANPSILINNNNDDSSVWNLIIFVIRYNN
jgi:hypothetical protein